LVVFIFAISYLSAILNCFLVFFFLEVVKGKKSPQTAEQVDVKVSSLLADYQ